MRSLNSISSEHLHNRYKAIVIGGSAGSFQVVVSILTSLPPGFNIPIIMVLHRLKHIRHGFVEALGPKSKLPVKEPDDKEMIKRGNVYLAPSNYHLCMELGNTFSLSTEPMFNNSRPSIDITFESAAFNFREKMVGIILSGANRDGAAGLRQVAERKGLCIVQRPEDSTIETMPRAALDAVPNAHSLQVKQIIAFLHELQKLTPA